VVLSCKEGHTGGAKRKLRSQMTSAGKARPATAQDEP